MKGKGRVEDLKTWEPMLQRCLREAQCIGPISYGVRSLASAPLGRPTWRWPFGRWDSHRREASCEPEMAEVTNTLLRWAEEPLG